MTQHGRVAEIRQKWGTLAAGTGTQTYRMASPENGGPRNCPVVGCPDIVATMKEMWVQLLHWNVLDTVVILEEGNSPHP